MLLDFSDHTRSGIFSQKLISRRGYYYRCLTSVLVREPVFFSPKVDKTSPPLLLLPLLDFIDCTRTSIFFRYYYYYTFFEQQQQQQCLSAGVPGGRARTGPLARAGGEGRGSRYSSTSSSPRPPRALAGRYASARLARLLTGAAAAAAQRSCSRS